MAARTDFVGGIVSDVEVARGRRLLSSGKYPSVASAKLSKRQK
jgi:hypothetical protein